MGKRRHVAAQISAPAVRLRVRIVIIHLLVREQPPAPDWNPFISSPRHGETDRTMQGAEKAACGRNLGRRLT
jgi:hypothetical protein